MVLCMPPSKGESASALNGPQQNHLRVTCQHADKMLSEMESILHASESKSPFPRYRPELSPAQRKVIEDYVARLRSQLVRVVESQGMEIPEARVAERHAIHVSLSFLDIAFEELAPKYMRGYGEVAEEAMSDLNGIVNELRGIVSQMEAYLAQTQGLDLNERLARLASEGHDTSQLKVLEEVISRHSFVEFRSALQIALDRLEDQRFEIAVFGRVSSGKSSLLNAVLQTDLLPVGVTPITAVPTRIMVADQPGISVRFIDHLAEKVDISRLVEYVTEQRNPGNIKHVSELVVRIPSPRLPEGIVFVDTPGLGSLASRGAAETLAYLPRCDVGVVLVDATSTLSSEDIATVRRLIDAAAPVSVLLSKADLLSEDDRPRMLDYVRRHLAEEIGAEIPVHAVSVRPGYESLLESWLDSEVYPLLARRQELRAESIARKIGVLRSAVRATLEAHLRRSSTSETGKGAFAAAEQRLRDAAAKLEQAGSRLSRVAAEMVVAGENSLQDAVSAAVKVEPSERASTASRLISELVENKAQQVFAYVVQLASELGQDLNSVASSLGFPDPSAQDELRALVREMPRSDLPLDQLKFGEHSLAAGLGISLLERQLRRDLANSFARPLTASLEMYARLLVGWGEAIVRRMQKVFDSYAETYRAHIQRTSGGGGLSADKRSAVAADLARLGAPAEAAAPVARTA